MYGYGYSRPPMTVNNPFANANDPNHASSRYPAVSAFGDGTTTYNQYPVQQYQEQGYYQPQPSPNQYQLQAQQQFSQQSYVGGGQLPYMNSAGQGQYGGMTSPGYGTALMSGTSYGYLSGQHTGLPQQHHQRQQLGPAQEQITNNPGYVAQFDPYGPLSQWDGTSSQQQQQQQYQQQQQSQQQQGYQPNYGDALISPTTTSFSGVSPTGDPHPREFIRTHKPQLDKWDPATWQQLLRVLDVLKNSWGVRKTVCSNQLSTLNGQLAYAGHYQPQVQAEMVRVQELVKDADSKFDSVAASAFQMQETLDGYRQSSDPSSKLLVRQATNAAINSLPDWPSTGPV